MLINILISKGDCYDAECYALVAYDNLRDEKNGIDQGSEAVAMGAHNLAVTFFRQNRDLIKAARESLHIRSLVYGRYDHGLATSSQNL